MIVKKKKLIEFYKIQCLFGKYFWILIIITSDFIENDINIVSIYKFYRYEIKWYLFILFSIMQDEGIFY